MNEDHTSIITKGIMGIGFNVLALITSVQEELEWATRMTSLCVGIIVGLLTIYSLVKHLRKD